MSVYAHIFVEVDIISIFFINFTLNPEVRFQLHHDLYGDGIIVKHEVLAFD